MAKLKAPENCGGCSFEGTEYQIDKETGIVEVPDEAVAALLDHGFTIAKSRSDKSPVAAG